MTGSVPLKKCSVQVGGGSPVHAALRKSKAMANKAVVFILILVGSGALAVASGLIDIRAICMGIDITLIFFGAVGPKISSTQTPSPPHSPKIDTCNLPLFR